MSELDKEHQKELIKKVIQEDEEYGLYDSCEFCKYKRLEDTFEELLKQHIVSSELKDFYRNKAYKND